MARNTGYKQRYSSNKINASSAGRTGQTKTGRFSGAAQGFSVGRGGAKSNGGKMISRRERYGQVRRGLGLSGG